MNASSGSVPESLIPSQGAVPLATAVPRPLYWSVRRELWENRSIYIAPMVIAAVVLFGFLISMITLPHRMRAVSVLDPAHQRSAIEKPYDVLAGLIIVTAFLIGVFYCLDALHGERRDRSILFWKSLPLSDRATVLSKASIPLVVLPLLAFTIISAGQLIMLLLNTVALLTNGGSLAILWARLPMFQMPVALLYALTAIALWHAPLYAWLLLVSAWARRAVFLWAVLPPLLLCVFERIAFRTSYCGGLLGDRLIGWFTRAFVPQVSGHVPSEPLMAMTPGNFLSAPGLWIGLAAAALLLAATVRLRRYREPI